MAQLVVINPEQLAEREKPKGHRGRRRSAERTRIIEEYKAAMAEAEPGYGADVLLAPGDQKRVVRQNLKAAAGELGKALDFRPIKDPSRMHFRVITLEEKAAKPKRGGRPRKQQLLEQFVAVGANEQARIAGQEQAEVAQPGAETDSKRRGRRPSPPAS